MTAFLKAFETGAAGRLGGFHDGDVLRLIVDSESKTLQLWLRGFAETSGGAGAETVRYEFSGVSRLITQPAPEPTVEHLIFPENGEVDFFTATTDGTSNIKLELKGLYGWTISWGATTISENVAS